MVSGYTTMAGITNRANAALLEIERIISDTSVPSAERLEMVARRMLAEPILTDQSHAAYAVRRNATVRRTAARR